MEELVKNTLSLSASSNSNEISNIDYNGNDNDNGNGKATVDALLVKFHDTIARNGMVLYKI
jgi:hypothetical protein